jgi:hypothetical protein
MLLNTVESSRKEKRYLKREYRESEKGEKWKREREGKFL